MPTFNALVESQKETDKTFRVKILVYHKGKKKRISTEWYVTEKDLTITKKNKKSNLKGSKSEKTTTYTIKSPYYKNLIHNKTEEYRRICENTPKVESMTVEDIVDLLTTKSQDKFQLDIIQYLMDRYNELLKEGRKKSAEDRKTVANSLKRFIRKDTLDVNEITTDFITSYISWLKGDNERHPRICVLYPGVISKALDELKYEHNDEDNGIRNITVNPFEKIRQGRRIGIGRLLLNDPEKAPTLTVEQIQKIIDLKIFDTKREELARDMFLLSFMLIGINSVDLYHCTDYSKEILTYNRQKVKGRRADKGLMMVKVEPEVLPLMEKYKNLNKDKDNVFHFSTQYANHTVFNKAIGKGLDELEKKVGVPNMRYYSARRSWSTLARNVLVIKEDDISDALNHTSDGGKAVTKGYIDKTFQNVWKNNKKMLKKFDWSNLMDYHKSKLEKGPKKVKKK